MTQPMLALWSLTLVALFTSIFALSAALRTSGRSLLKQLSEHSTRLAELSEQDEKLSHQLRNIRVRLNMAAYRRRKAGRDHFPEDELAEPTEETETASSAEEWKRRMNRQLALKGVPK